MKKYIGKRIINFLIVLVGVSILSFLLIAWSGKDPAEIIAHRGVSNPTPEQIEMMQFFLLQLLLKNSASMLLLMQ